MLKRIALVAALLLPVAGRAQTPPPPPPPMPSGSPDGMPRTALLIDAKLGAATTVNGGAAGTFSLVAIPSVDIGVRLIGRLHITVGFTLFRNATSTANSDTANTAFTFNPQFAVDIIKSADDKVAFYALAGVPIGGLFIDAPGSAADQQHLVIGYNIGVGARVALHRMFALGLEGGVFGLFADTSNNSSIGITTVYGALTGTFFYELGR